MAFQDKERCFLPARRTACRCSPKAAQSPPPNSPLSLHPSSLKGPSVVCVDSVISTLSTVIAPHPHMQTYLTSSGGNPYWFAHTERIPVLSCSEQWRESDILTHGAAFQQTLTRTAPRLSWPSGGCQSGAGKGGVLCRARGAVEGAWSVGALRATVWAAGLKSLGPLTDCSPPAGL